MTTPCHISCVTEANWSPDIPFLSPLSLDRTHCHWRHRSSSLVLPARPQEWLDANRPARFGRKVHIPWCRQFRLQRSIPELRHGDWRRPHPVKCHCFLALATSVDLQRWPPSLRTSDVYPHRNDCDITPTDQHRQGAELRRMGGRPRHCTCSYAHPGVRLPQRLPDEWGRSAHWMLYGWRRCTADGCSYKNFPHFHTDHHHHHSYRCAPYHYHYHLSGNDKY